MKKNLFIILIVSVYSLSCSEKKSETTTTSSTTQKNLSATKEINKAIESGDVSKLDDYIDANVVDHASPLGDVKGIDSIKAMLAKIHTMGTNMKMESIKTLADDEYVFEWMRLTGTTATADLGMPIGTNYDINAVQVSKFKDGKVIEHWEFMQPADMAKMMGPQDSPPLIKDSIKIDTAKNRL